MGDTICVDETKDGCAKDPGPYPDRPPRLIVGINRYDAERQQTNRELKPRALPPHPDGDDPVLCPEGATYIGEVLDWVAKGLATSEMELAWATDAGKSGRVMESGETPEDVWETCWAKQVAEMFLQNSYDMPENVASFPGFKNYGANLQVYQQQTYIFQRLQLEYVPPEKWGKDADRPTAPRVPNTDPAYSLATECQHLTTYILISRGFLIERDMLCCGVTAGAASGGCQMFKPEGKGRWISAKQDGNLAKTDYAIDTLQITPGSIYVFDPNNGDNPAVQAPGSHIWPVLRIDREGKRIQNLEGGGEADTLPPVPWSSAHSGVSAYVGAAVGAGDARQEGTWRTSGASPRDVCGIGIAPKAENLDRAVAHMMRARPVGLARLAIQRRTLVRKPGTTTTEETFTPVYISSFIRMWGKGDLDNYAPSRFLLSLRSTPYFEDLRAYWFLYAPRSYLATLMWREGARGDHVRDFFEDAMRTEWTERAAAARRMQEPPPARRMRLTRQDLQCPLIASHDASGFARFRWRHVVSGNSKEAVDATWAPGDIDGGLEKIMLLPDSARDELLPGLDVRWDGEYFHPSLRPVVRHAPPLFDFEHAFAPEENQC